jgi:hypothetical protein
MTFAGAGTSPGLAAGSEIKSFRDFESFNIVFYLRLKRGSLDLISGAFL